MRDEVRAVLARQWGEQVSVLAVGANRRSYRVEGRRGDGSVVGERRVRQALRVVLVVLAAPFLIVWGILAGIVSDVVGTSGSTDKGALMAVEGAPHSGAVRLADAARDADTLWLAWSRTRLALVADGRVLWQGTEHERRSFKARTGAIAFADGSTITFTPSKAELALLRERGGRP